MKGCPCCSTALLRHIRQGRVYWYCTSCHEEMPNFYECAKVHQQMKKTSLGDRYRLEQLLGVSKTQDALTHL